MNLALLYFQVIAGALQGQIFEAVEGFEPGFGGIALKKRSIRWSDADASGERVADVLKSSLKYFPDGPILELN